MIAKKVTTVIMLCAVLFSYGQKLRIEQGNFDFLKGQKEVNVEFVYDNMTLLKKNLSNEQYVKEHMLEVEEKKGKAAARAWEKSWYSSREIIYAPKFLELMNRYLHGDYGIHFDLGLDNAKYTLIVDTIWVFPGWDAGVMKQPAKVTTSIKVVETANSDNILVMVSSKDAPGDQWGS
ncbi:MAG: hypothetical protein AB3N16_02915, partial [Flavobacteriaceae bacterium]